MLFNLNSSPQMQEFLYNFLKLEPVKEKNEKGNYSVAEEILVFYAESLDIKFCELLLNYRKLSKAKSTYIDGIKKRISLKDCLLHPEFWLMVAETYRSSSSNPNFQNMPKHGDIIPGFNWANIRRMFTAISKEWLLGEVDYIGAEVKIAAMLGDDPVMIDDIVNDMDMHSHWARELFGLDGDYPYIKVNYPDFRFLAKNDFTFANFFGAGNTSIAENMRKHPAYEAYVRSKWNKSGNWESYFKDFSEDHVAGCQEAFFTRYSIFKAWQDKIVSDFYENGYIENPFGFRRRYPLRRNEIINYPIQSTSFHILLNALIELDEMMLNYALRSHISGQIHDSGFFNIFKPEVYDVMELTEDILTDTSKYEWARKVPLAIEWEFGQNWLEMNPVIKCNNRLTGSTVPFRCIPVNSLFTSKGPKKGLVKYLKIDDYIAKTNAVEHLFKQDAECRLIL